MTKRVLLIGATGTFGSRLAGHLARMPELHLVLTSRNLDRARAVARDLQHRGAVAQVDSIAMHVERDLAAVLSQVKPWLVIDASGPFQFASYDVPRAALEAGAHYLDLADAQDFLMGFARNLDHLAKTKNLVARAGCSTTPAITTAVVDEVTRGWQRVDAVDTTIIPGGSNTIGPALAAAVLAQAGVPITQFRNGRYQQVVGWQKAARVTVLRLGTFRAVPAETVDPMIMPERYGLTARMTFRAGLVSPIEQRGFELLAWLRKTGLFKRIDTLAPVLAAGRKITRLWSHDRGGMVIEICGIDGKGRWSKAVWSMLAQKGDGPHVPILPLVAAVRMLLLGAFSSGARMIEGDIPLEHIVREFQPLAISAQLDVTSRDRGVFDQVLGEQSGQLPAIVRDFHDPLSHPVWHGEADIERGRSLVSRLIGRLIGLPAAGRARPVQVSVERDAEGHELWTRNFGGQVFHSRMGSGADGKLTETFGPFVFTLGLAASESCTQLPVESGRCFGFALPRFLLPSSNAREFADEKGRFQFDVRIDLPIFGLLAHYQGWLVPNTEKEFVYHDSAPRLEHAAQ
jgi:NAD(P)-dependent dehydrogenase (short-subunit alcohol dehydrogenase family)